MTTDTLDFPEILTAEDVAAVQTITASEVVATPITEPKAADLVKIDLQAVALAHFGDWRGSVAKARTELSTLVLDLSTQTRIDEAKSLRHRLIGQPRAEARKVAEALKSRLSKVSKAVGAELDSAVAAYNDAETLITPQIEAREAEIEAQKAEAARVEAERKQRHNDGITLIRSYGDRAAAPGMTAERIQKGIDLLEAVAVGDDWQEYRETASNAKVATLIRMRELLSQAQVREDEAARLEAQRVENERIAAALAAQQKALADQAAALQRQAAELAEKQAAQAAEQQAAAAKVVILHPDESAGLLQELMGKGLPPDGMAPLIRGEVGVVDCAFRIVPSAETPDVATLPDSAPEPEPESVAVAEPVTADHSATLRDDPQDEAMPMPTPTLDDELRGLLAHIELAFSGRFPNHPKPDQAWWGTLRHKAGCIKAVL